MNIGLTNVKEWIFGDYRKGNGWKGKKTSPPKNVAALLSQVREKMKEVVDEESSSTDPIEFYDCKKD